VAAPFTRRRRRSARSPLAARRRRAAASCVDDYEEAVEEDAHISSSAGSTLVQLVDGEAGDAGVQLAGAKRDDVEAYVLTYKQHVHLEPCGLSHGLTSASPHRGGRSCLTSVDKCKEPFALCACVHGWIKTSRHARAIAATEFANREDESQ